jgi:hypothetical protein
MTTHYVFVDFENIQPEAEALAFCNDQRIKILIFVNGNQKLSVNMVKVLQPFGERVEYLEMNGSGKNALDFMIAFYIGQVWVENPEAKFFVVSKDTGFDPLIRHLNSNRPGIAKRLTDFNYQGLEMSPSNPPIQPVTLKQRTVTICEALKALPENNLPNSSATLEAFIIAIINDPDYTKRQASGLIKFMIRNELISIDDDVLKYKLENFMVDASGQFVAKGSSMEPPSYLAADVPADEPPMAPPIETSSDLAAEDQPNESPMSPPINGSSDLAAEDPPNESTSRRWRFPAKKPPQEIA